MPTKRTTINLTEKKKDRGALKNIQTHLPWSGLLSSMLFSLLLLFPSGGAWAAKEITLAFENQEIHTVVKMVSELTGTTFLFDPERVKGKISILSPKKVSTEEALKLLESALALQGYSMLQKEEGIWIVPAEYTALGETIIEVVPLHYARAEEVAYTLNWIAPYGVRIVPYYPTNSLIISGDPETVQSLIGIIKGTAQGDKGR